MSEQQIRQYFNIKIFKEQTNLLNEKLIEQLSQQIMNDKLQISSYQVDDNKIQKQLKINIKMKQIEQPEEKLHDLIMKKKLMQNQLMEIQRQQQRLKKQSNVNSVKLKQPIKQNRVQFTKEDLEKIKQLKKAQKNFEQNLHKKRIALEQKIKNEKQKEEKQQQHMKILKTIEKRKQLQENRQRMIRIRQESKIRFEQEKKKMKQLLEQGTLHNRMNEEWKNKKQQQIFRQQEIKKQYKSSKAVNFMQIQQHERKHQQKLKLQQIERQKRILQLNQYQIKKLYQSRFHNDIKEEQNQNEKEQAEKKQQKKYYVEKINKFAQKVRQMYKPKIKQKNSQQAKSTQSKQHRCLSVVDLHKKGNEYMKKVHENIGNRIIIDNTVQKQVQKQLKYKNYLKNKKLNRTSADNSIQNKKQKNKNKYLNEINLIMKKQNLTQEEKFYQAKIVAEKIQHKIGDDSEKIVESINAKIQILKQISDI